MRPVKGQKSFCVDIVCFICPYLCWRSKVPSGRLFKRIVKKDYRPLGSLVGVKIFKLELIDILKINYNFC